jgi:hypothetical protein
MGSTAGGGNGSSISHTFFGQSDRITCLPGRVSGGRSSDFWALIFQLQFLEANKWWVLPGFGLAFASVNKFSQTRNHHHFNHLTSLSVIIFEESHHLFNTRVKLFQSLYYWTSSQESSFKTPSFLLSLRFWRRSMSIAGIRNQFTHRGASGWDIPDSKALKAVCDFKIMKKATCYGRILADIFMHPTSIFE